MEINRRLLEDLISVNANRIGSNKRQVFQQFSSRLHKGNTAAELYGKLVTCSGNADRVQVVKEYFTWFPLQDQIKAKYKKNSDISTAFRNLGNESLERKLYRESIFSYNVALLFAPRNSPELGLAYANRSVPLHALGMTEEALTDIQLALDNHYPLDKRGKLNIRKTSYEKLVMDRATNNPDLEAKIKSELEKRNSFYHEMFRVKNPSPTAQAMEDCVEIKCTESHGRLLVATAEIDMGKTVLVESPFVSVLKQALNWDVDHCQHCLKKVLNVIPCPTCVFAVYCGEKCRQEAQTQYHKYECPCMPELHCNLSEALTEGIFVFHSRSFHLMFKTICIVGPETLYKIYTDEYKIAECGKIIGSDPTSGVYENSYRAIYNLMAIIDPSEGHDFVLLSLILSRTLRDNCGDFFSNIPPAENERFADFIATTILHHFECFRRNVFGFSEIKDMKYATLRPFMENKEEPKVYYDSDGFAIATFATASLFNHSCDPNVIRFTGKRFGRTAFVALKPLKKGEELVISYGPVYGQIDDHGAKSRRDILSRKYNFLCDCIACSSNWPPVRELQSKAPEFCCNSCAPKFTHISKASPEFSLCRLMDNFKCKLCKKQHSRKFYEKELDRVMKSVEVCKMLTLSNAAPVEAVGNLKAAINFLQNSLCPPDKNSTFAPKIFREAVNLIIYFANSDQ